MGDEENPRNFIDVIFLGFRSPRYTQVPDELFDVLLPRISGPELKVTLYVIRRTLGFKKDSDSISLSQICSGITRKQGDALDGGTGLSKFTVALVLKSLVEKNILVRRRNSSKEKGNEATMYALNMIDTPLSDFRIRGVQSAGLRGASPFFGQALDTRPDKGLSTTSDTQETVLQKTANNTLNVKRASKKIEDQARTDGEHEAISKVVTRDILSVLKDDKSRGFYLKVARRVPSEVIYQLLSEIRAEIINNPQSEVQNPASIFTKKIKELAAKRGIEL